MAQITTVNHNLPDETHSVYDVNFSDDSVLTTVTHAPSMVERWIEEIEFIHRRRIHVRRLIAGLDIEWRPNNRRYTNPVATLQLCVGRRCLIFQLLHAPSYPQALADFLANPDHTFVGVGIDADAEKLQGDHGLGVAHAVDLRFLAAEKLGAPQLRSAGIKTLVREVLGTEMNKPGRVTRSRWDSQFLSPAQVSYACLDAFLSFEVGRCLNASDW